MFFDLIQHLEEKPGIYLMLSKQKPIYIGKAKNLKKRLLQYFQNKPSSYRIQVMLSQVDDLKVIVTDSEAEALILENKYIKRHQPKYNILLKDDKSFPYLVFSKHAFPRLQVIRSKKLSKDEVYFGPYVNQKQAHVLLEQLQKVFQIRNCSDSFFRNRMRPCMQYEIGRCKAPCVKLIHEKDYKKDVEDAKRFLKGKGNHQALLMEKMYQYANDDEYEKAAFCRDLLQSIGSSTLHTTHSFDVFYQDVLGLQVGMVLLQVVDDRLQNVHVELIDVSQKHVEDDWLEQYVYDYYSRFPLPKVLVLPEKRESLSALGKVEIRTLNEKKYQKWLSVAKENILAYRQSKADEVFQWPSFWIELESFLRIPIDQILCVDVSHHGGKSAYASLVMCQSNGMQKSKYRAYKVSKGGDDYDAIREVISKIRKEKLTEGTLLIIDGGKGQIKVAKEALEKRELALQLTSISKGKERVWGDEKFYRVEEGKIIAMQWPKDILKYILHIRDEAHDFAIRTHRRSLRKLSLRSVFEDIEGIGEEKKKSLLGYFGGLDALKCATLDEIAKVPGIGKVLAKKIYDALHVE